MAEGFFEGLECNAFFMMPESEDGDARFRERVENVLERRNPEARPF